MLLLITPHMITKYRITALSKQDNGITTGLCEVNGKDLWIPIIESKSELIWETCKDTWSIKKEATVSHESLDNGIPTRPIIVSVKAN